jgi:hypothetical protein
VEEQGRSFYDTYKVAVENRNMRAAHIYSQGTTNLTGCEITDEKGLGIIAGGSAAWFWIVVKAGTLLLSGSRFSASSDYSFACCPYSRKDDCEINKKNIFCDGPSWSPA